MDVAVSGNYVYIINWNGDLSSSSLAILNVADPNEPSLSGTFDTENAGDLALSGDHAYIVDWINGLRS